MRGLLLGIVLLLLVLLLLLLMPLQQLWRDTTHLRRRREGLLLLLLLILLPLVSANEEVAWVHDVDGVRAVGERYPRDLCKLLLVKYAA